ncbi:ELM1/GtrOC1 family putative glycosyltransferase [Solimonas terrae]|uniref:Nucleoside-diphosphate sugar epimerase n=1 Tax=Solimonas terrae TaxID=1396819 RepID=A0A6M2BU35_9GAMM|nr:ELM1/GtrOC1 family putative glycosyltransferase [Solimonas terrae]NGY05988.1 hypothetical protein [Solimonas terrae]
MSSDAAAAGLWLLTGDRPGEVAQQRRLAAATGLPCREIQVTQLRTVGGRPRFDLDALQPPWPRIALSFGKTLAAALHLRHASGGRTRIVHLGRARGVAADALDLIIPMPQDQLANAANVLRIRMPFNYPDAPADSAGHDQARLLALQLPRPWTALIIGGATRQLRFSRTAIAALVRDTCARARQRGGSVLISTSPRTPASAIAALRAAQDAPGEFYAFRRNDPHNPLASYLQLADELIVTGDSVSMIAECWRSGRPVWVAPLRDSLWHRLGDVLRAVAPARLMANGQVAVGSDVNAWIAALASAGHVGHFGRSDPTRPYSARDDDDLSRAVARIRALLD